MKLPENRFKRGLAEGRQQIGLWCSLPGAFTAENVAGRGFDCLMFDTEPSPSDVDVVLSSSRRSRDTALHRDRHGLYGRGHDNGILARGAEKNAQQFRAA